jgi:hypothetical protein
MGDYLAGSALKGSSNNFEARVGIDQFILGFPRDFNSVPSEINGYNA